MPDVVLIQPGEPVSDQTIFDSVIQARTNLPPIGLGYLGTVLRESGYSVELIDFSIIPDARERGKTIERVVSCAPGIVGISTMTPTYPSAVKMANQMRRSLGSTTKILMGGYHVTHLPEDCLRSFTADIVIRGEGEEAILRLAELILNGAKDSCLSEVEGISYRDNDGNVVHNPPKILRLRDLDRLPFPDRDLMNIAKYRNPATISSARGCSDRCIFCAAGAWGSVFSRSPENVVNEIEFLITKYGFRHVYFVDNTFTVNKDRTMKILTLMKERNVRIDFTLEARAPSVDEELIRAMSAGGCIAIQFGVESGNPEILRKIKKGVTLQQVDEAVELCLKYGIKPLCSFIIGHPFDDRQTVRDTINYAKKLKRKGAMVVFAVLEVYPGTEIFDKRDELGVSIIDSNFSKWSEGHFVLHTKNLSRLELVYLHGEADSEVRSI